MNGIHFSILLMSVDPVYARITELVSSEPQCPHLQSEDLDQNQSLSADVLAFGGGCQLFLDGTAWQDG